jgi:hypothetical protein
VTESEWLAATDPAQMLALLQGKAPKRKELLFGVACCRRVAHLFEGRRFWTVDEDEGPYLPRPSEFIEATERAAEQPAPLRFGEYGDDCPEDGFSDEGHATYAADAALYAANAERASAYAALAAAADSEGLGDEYQPTEVISALPAYAAERAAQSELLRDIIGNPFRPVAADPRWLTAAVVGLARAIDAERAFDRLPILADALEEAGCDDADVLAHCRSDGPHARGCWVVDLLLGKS